MRRERTRKIVEIAVLVFAIVGVSIGFAAYAENLNISSIFGTVNPEDTFTLQFSTGTGTPVVGNLTHDVDDTTSGATGSATMAAGGASITEVSATFKKPGDQVVIKFNVTNTSIYSAYLKTITFSKEAATCEQNELPETTICAGMTMSISVGSSSKNYSTTNIDTTLSNDVPNNLIAAYDGTTYSSLPVTLTMTYGGSTAVDTPISVDFGSITLGYSTSNS